MRRCYSCFVWNVVVARSPIERILLNEEFFYCLVGGEEQSVLPVGGEQPKEVRLFQYPYKMGKMLAAVEYIVSNCFTGESEAVTFVNLLIH